MAWHPTQTGASRFVVVMRSLIPRSIYVSCAGLSNSIISNTKKNSMKKLMLIMAGALVSLSACSKSADEPVAQPQNQNVAEQETITLHIEGEREDVVVKDQEGRALNLKATVGGPLTSYSRALRSRIRRTSQALSTSIMIRALRTLTLSMASLAKSPSR